MGTPRHDFTSQAASCISSRSRLHELDQKYAKLNLLPGVQASYFPNLDAAIANWGALSTLPIGQTLYITYKSVSYYDNNPYVTNERGEWIRASPTTYSTFQGLLFKHQPLNNFGWIIDAVSPYREPRLTQRKSISASTAVMWSRFTIKWKRKVRSGT